MKTIALLLSLLSSSITFSQWNGANVGLLLSTEYGSSDQHFTGIGAWYQKDRIYFGARLELIDFGCFKELDPNRFQLDLRYLLGNGQQKLTPFIGASVEFYSKKVQGVRQEYIEIKRPNGHCYPDGKNSDEYLLDVDFREKRSNINFAITPGFRYEISPFLFVSTSAKIGLNQFGYSYDRTYYHDMRYNQTSSFSRNSLFVAGEVLLEFCISNKRKHSVSSY